MIFSTNSRWQKEGAIGESEIKELLLYKYMYSNVIYSCLSFQYNNEEQS